jgi:CheY-like chemotaxis protein
VSQKPTNTILFAEDNDAMRELGCRILSNAGYNLIIAEDGLNALNLFEKNTDIIDLAILDVIMPRMNGRLVLTVSANSDPLPVLFCSAFTGICSVKWTSPRTGRRPDLQTI